MALMRDRAVYAPLVFLALAAGEAAAFHQDAPEYAFIHYNRPDGDYGDQASTDFNDFWGLHLWGEGIDPAEATEWARPKPFLGATEYGRFAWVKLSDTPGPVNFIVHRGDAKDTSPDWTMNPWETPEVFIRRGDDTVHGSSYALRSSVKVNYRRDGGDYGVFPSADFNDYWGLHLWGPGLASGEATEWTSPKPFDGVPTVFGASAEVGLSAAGGPVNFILHKGDAKDPAGVSDVSAHETPELIS